MTTIQKFNAINTLLEIAKGNFTGEYTESHMKSMAYIYTCIEDLKKDTGKDYIIDGANACLVER